MITKQDFIQEYTSKIEGWSEFMNLCIKKENYDTAREYAENILITIDSLRYIKEKFEI